MKLVRFLEITLGVAIVLLFIGVFIGPANAAAGGPFAGQVFGSAPVECPEGYVCLTEIEYAALVADAESCELLPTFTPTATEPPKETPTPPVDPTPTPEDKAKCNRGVGNYEENCDPGNSSGQGQGDGRPAGEDRDEDQGPPGQGSGNPH